MFKKISSKKGIELLKERAVVDIVKEYKQLDYINVVLPENPDVPTPGKNKKNRAVKLIKDK